MSQAPPRLQGQGLAARIKRINVRQFEHRQRHSYPLRALVLVQQGIQQRLRKDQYLIIETGGGWLTIQKKLIHPKMIAEIHLCYATWLQDLNT